MNINSLENEKVKYWVKLNGKSFRDKEGLFIVETPHLVNEALKNGIVEEIITLEKKNDFNNTYYVNENIMKKISNMKSIPKIIAVCKKLEEKSIGNKIIILDEIQDPGNLGTIIRSAVAFNYDTIILSNNSVDLYNDKVLRASEGMIFNINIIRRDIDEFILELKNNNYEIYGTKVDGGINISNIKSSNKFALIMGNEGNGVKQKYLELCNSYIYIPINDKCESLNVSVATSIILYELNK